jgi:acetyl-CoA C-acetyltransferase
VTPADIKYASIYDSFTITVLMQLEDLGFCEKGQGGKFVADGNLISGVGKLPFNTDGGGLCNNHPANRGGITKVIEAVRQLRGEAHPAVQVPNCDLALAHGDCLGGMRDVDQIRRPTRLGGVDMTQIAQTHVVNHAKHT